MTKRKRRKVAHKHVMLDNERMKLEGNTNAGRYQKYQKGAVSIQLITLEEGGGGAVKGMGFFLKMG